MISVRNTSSSRTILHQDGTVVHRIEPTMVKDFEEDIANAILSGWNIAAVNGEQASPVPATPWEHSAGPTWEKAKQEFRLMEHSISPAMTVGPDRPAVVEPPIPKDAIDEHGNVIESKLNTHVCNICERPYKLLGHLRNHQRKEHKA